MGSQGAARIGLGRMGEQLAAQALLQRGYRIRERNMYSPYGEIDIIAEHEQDLVFVEVKTRRGRLYGLPEEAVTKRKRQTILRVAMFYLARYADSECSWRVDVVAVQLSCVGKLEEIRIYQHIQIEEE